MAETALAASIDLTEPDIHAVADQAFESADNVNGNSIANTGVEVIVADNTSGGALTITFDDKDGTAILASAASIAAGEVAIFGPFDPNIYGTTVTFTPSASTLDLLVVDLTRTKNLISRRKH